MPRIDKQADKVAAQVRAGRDEESGGSSEAGAPRLYLPTGSTLLNVAMTDFIDGGLVAGTMSNIVGDKSAGKTMLALTACATVANDPRFTDWRIVFDETERSTPRHAMISLFGEKTANRIEPGHVGDDGEDSPSYTIEEFRDSLFTKLEDGRPTLYVLDCLDVLTSAGELKHMEEVRKGKATGDYGMQKAKELSRLVRLCNKDLSGTNSHLMIVSQVRQNIGAQAFEPKYRRNGGQALDHWCHHIIWLAVKKTRKINRTRYGKQQRFAVGQDVLGKLTKNKETGKLRQVEWPFFYDYGVDNIESCVQWLLSTGAWGGSGNSIDTKGWVNKRTNLSGLVELIENEQLEDELTALVQDEWHSIEESIRVNAGRKRRFT